MFIIDLSSRLAIYEQIVRQVEEGILKGLLQPKEQLPSVRSLSLELALNPNTVSKAYTELERRGIIYTAVGKGCFIAPNAYTVISQKITENFEEFLRQVKNYKAAGVSAEKLISLIQQLYKEETE